MFGSLFDKVTGLFDRRFVLGLLLPTFAFSAGIGALVATGAGWGHAISWWHGLSTSRQVIAATAVAVGLVFLATVLGTQVTAMTRVLEGYWWRWLDITAGEAGRRRQGRRARRLVNDTSRRGYLRTYLAFAPAGFGIQPTRLGNTLRALMGYAGDPERWGIDAEFWWPRLYLIIPDSARRQVDAAKLSMDQMVVLSWLSAAFTVAAVGFGIAGLPLVVWAACAGGGLALSWLTYRVADSSAAVYGDLVRSCFDLFRTDLLTQLGWPIPDSLPAERRLWTALAQQLYRRGTTSEDQDLLNASRLRPPHRQPSRIAERHERES